MTEKPEVKKEVLSDSQKRLFQQFVDVQYSILRLPLKKSKVDKIEYILRELGFTQAEIVNGWYYKV